MSKYITKNNIVESEQLSSTVLAMLSGEISPHIASYVTFPKIALARSSMTENSVFAKKYSVVMTKTGCGCQGTTIREINATEGQKLNGMYALELSNLFEPFDFESAFAQYGIISSDPFMADTSIVDQYSGSDPYILNKKTAVGIQSMISQLSDVRKYQVNTVYYGSFHTFDTVVDIGFRDDSTITGVAKLNRDMSEDGGLAQNNISVNINIDISKYDSDNIYVVGRLLSSEYATAVNKVNMFDDVFYPNVLVTKEDTVNALGRVIDDWKKYSEQNKYIIDMYICHYNCYMDSNSEGGGTGINCYDYTTSKITTSDSFKSAILNNDRRQLQIDDSLNTASYYKISQAGTCIGSTTASGCKAEWTTQKVPFLHGGYVTLKNVYTTTYNGNRHDNDKACNITNQSAWSGYSIGLVTLLGAPGKGNRDAQKLRDLFVKKWCDDGGDPTLYDGGDDPDNPTVKMQFKSLYIPEGGESKNLVSTSTAYRTGTSQKLTLPKKSVISTMVQFPARYYFAGWTTSYDSLSITNYYKAGAVLTGIDKLSTFYEVWTGPKIAVTYKNRTAKYDDPTTTDAVGSPLTVTTNANMHISAGTDGVSAIVPTYWLNQRELNALQPASKIQFDRPNMYIAKWSTADKATAQTDANTIIPGEELEAVNPATGKNVTSLTLYASWCQQEPHVVSFDTTEGTYEDAPTVASQEVEYGQKATRPADPTWPDKHFAFVDWYKTPDSTAEVFDFNQPVYNDLTAYGKWTWITFAVTFNTRLNPSNPKPAGQPVPPVQNVIWNEHATRPTEVPVIAGYSFDDWYQDSARTIKFNFVAIAVVGPLTVYAKYTPNTYTATFDTRGGHETYPSQTLVYPALVQKPTPDPTADGQLFTGWAHLVGTEEVAFDFNTPYAGDVKLLATWRVAPSS